MQSPIGVGLIGCGTIGYGVVRLLVQEAELYARRLGRRLELRRILDRRTDVGDTEKLVAPGLLTGDADAFFNTPDMQVVIELAGGKGIVSQFVRRALSMGKHVVTANKSLLAAEGPELFALARQHGVSIGFEASCGGGIPCITALNFGLMANQMQAIYGILNGTCNYILTEMTRKNKDYATALKEAQAAGFAEADPTLDVSGGDTAQKLAIYGSLAFGIQARGDQVPTEGIDKLSLADIKFGAELGYDIKLLGIAERTSAGVSLQVQPCFVKVEEPLAQVAGPFNAISVFGHSVGQVMLYGRGAGQRPTASAVVSDLMNIASGWYPKAFADLRIWCDQHEPVKLGNPVGQESRYYVRINALDKPGTLAGVTKALGDAGISLSGVVQHEMAEGKFVPVVITTHKAAQGALRAALAEIARLKVVEGEPVAIRIVDMPKG
ncbi:MAG: homoserine dehydrogenase [Phycisphaeraceae bacterium]|nr:homoserine dehydrogenase [Phycisphaeraceae bacterium]